MRRGFVILVSLSFSFSVFAQRPGRILSSQRQDTLIASKDTLYRLQEYESIDIPSNFGTQYKMAIYRLKRVYPLALEAARIIDSLDNQLATLKKTNKQKKLIRQTKNALTTNFKYVIKDLYTTEGVLLSKLIYRETGMTVNEVMKKYKGGLSAGFYEMVGALFEQDFDVKYDPKGEDFAVECALQDLINGTIYYNPTAQPVTKKQFKQKKKEEKEAEKKRKKEKKKQQAKKK